MPPKKDKGAAAVLFAKSTNKSECLHCHKCMADKHTVSHLLECNASRSLIRSEGENRHAAFLIRFYDFRRPAKYFLYAVVPQTKTLCEIDALLRREWMEDGCNHMSTFNLLDREEERRLSREREMFWLRKDRDSEAEDDAEDDFEQIMTTGERRTPKLWTKPLHEITSVGKKFSYNYDMGSTTKAGAEVLQVVHCESEEISLVARDVMPHVLCTFCDLRVAKYYIDDEDFICSSNKTVCVECKPRMPVGYYKLYEIRNSPRMAMCGYGLETFRVKKRRREGEEKKENEGEGDDEEEEDEDYDDYGDADESVEEQE